MASLKDFLLPPRTSVEGVELRTKDEDGDSRVEKISLEYDTATCKTMERIHALNLDECGQAVGYCRFLAGFNVMSPQILDGDQPATLSEELLMQFEVSNVAAMYTAMMSKLVPQVATGDWAWTPEDKNAPGIDPQLEGVTGEEAHLPE